MPIPIIGNLKQYKFPCPEWVHGLQMYPLSTKALKLKPYWQQGSWLPSRRKKSSATLSLYWGYGSFPGEVNVNHYPMSKSEQRSKYLYREQNNAYGWAKCNSNTCCASCCYNVSHLAWHNNVTKREHGIDSGLPWLWLNFAKRPATKYPIQHATCTEGPSFPTDRPEAITRGCKRSTMRRRGIYRNKKV